MALRIKLEVRSRSSGRVVETSALVNTGFETEKPQLLIPVRFAEKLKLWPPPPDAEVVELGTAGGPVKNIVVRNALEIVALTSDRRVGPVVCDAVISHMESEVLINDKLGEELKIIILGTGSGKWRFADDPPDKIRYSEKPQYW